MEAMRRITSIEFFDISLADITDYLGSAFEIGIVIDADVATRKVAGLRLLDVPLNEALLALGDAAGDVAFILRPSYIFVTTRANAETINAPCIPEDLPYHQSASALPAVY